VSDINYFGGSFFCKVLQKSINHRINPKFSQFIYKGAGNLAKIALSTRSQMNSQPYRNRTV